MATARNRSNEHRFAQDCDSPPWRTEHDLPTAAWGCWPPTPPPRGKPPPFGGEKKTPSPPTVTHHHGAPNTTCPPRRAFVASDARRRGQVCIVEGAKTITFGAELPTPAML